MVLSQRIGERWSGWKVAGGRGARGVDTPDDWQSSAGLMAALCSEKCGCVGEGCPGRGGDVIAAGLSQADDGAADGESWLTTATLLTEPAPMSSEAGMSTVEYAVGTVVAAAFAAVLYKIVTGDSVVAGLTNLINSALSTSF